MSRWSSPTTRRPSAWYTQHFGFIPSDVQVLPDGSPAVAFMRLDRGDRPTDHHTLALAQTFAPALNHISFELVDPDAVGIGGRLLRDRGWKPCLGHRPASSRQPDLRLLEGSLGRQARALLRRRSVHRGPADRRSSGEPRRHGAVGPAMPASFTRPKIAVATLVALVHGLRTSPDVTLPKLRTLLKIFG